MSEDKIKKIVYSPSVIEFVTVGVEFCAYLEQLQDLEKEEVTDHLIKVLPLLYLKTLLLPKTKISEDSFVETNVAEDDYNYILSKLVATFGEDDIYLEVFMDDMKYSDTPISANISEDVTDIYQDIRNFIAIYERAVEETMNDALHACSENFKLYWGQKLVNVMRALHALKFPSVGINTFDDFDYDNASETW